jgi:MFS transporter, FHS family, glucose/mannose:H+ symporter
MQMKHSTKPGRDRSVNHSSRQNSAQWLLAVFGILTFAFIGAIRALYGPLLPGFERMFAIDTSVVGTIFTGHGLGTLLGIFLPSIVSNSRLATRWLGIATVLLLVGSVALWLASSWLAVLTAAFVIGVGFGIHVIRLNSVFIAGFGSRGMAMSQLINAAYSFGSILGPLAIGLWDAASTRVFGVVALLALALLPASALADRRCPDIPSALPSWPGLRRGRSHALLAGGFGALSCFTGGVEASIAGWTTSFALSQGYSFGAAANLTAGFFACFFTGRVLAAVFADRAQPAALVIFTTASVTLLMFFAVVSRAAALAFAASGLALAPIFAATLVWFGQSAPPTRYGNALAVGGSLLGSAIWPALVGQVIGRFGIAAAPPAILCIAATALVAGIWIYVVRGTWGATG